MPRVINAVFNIIKADTPPSNKYADLPPLENAPSEANIPNVGRVGLGQNSSIIQSADNYARTSGIQQRGLDIFAPLDTDYSRLYADYYDRMPHNPDAPRTKQAYEALAKETEMQFEQMLSDGIDPYLFTDSDPYPNSPYEALGDIYQNKRLGIFSTKGGFGSDNGFDPTGNPLLQEMDFEAGGQRFLLNDAFRGIHDYYGHGKNGYGFRAGGEDNAFRSHSGMFSDLARQAIATETRGQNSFLNYGPKGASNRNALLADTTFSDQKTGILPNLVSTHRTPVGDDRRRRIDASGSDGLRGRLDGAIKGDGIVEAVHYSREPIDYIDPTRYGTGLSGRTVSERNMGALPDFYDRTFAGLNTTERPYKRERGIGTVENTVQLPIEQVYDILANPDNIKPGVKAQSSQERYAQITKKIFDAGYSAVFQDHPKLGKMLSIIDPLKTGKVLASVPAVALGTSAVLNTQDAEAGVIRNGAGDLFDLSKLDDVPDVPQVALERYEPKKGMPSNLEPLLTDEAAKRLEGYAREGEKAGGRGWYNLEPLREKFMEEHGQVEGTKIFNSYLDKVAATSPRSTVATNIRRASHLDILDRQGQQFGGLTNKDMPPGYGHIAHNTHDYSLRDLQQDGSFAALNRPKTSSFAENLKGNQAPMTIDTHNFAALKNSMEKKSPAKTQYKYLEDFQSEIAEKIGMTPAQFQASVWMGGGTGVADERPFMEVFDDVVASTAKRNGVTKKKALAGFIKGDSALYDLGPVMLAGGIALNSMSQGQQDQPSYLDQLGERGAGVLDATANIVSGAVSPIILGLEHMGNVGTPNPDGTPKSFEQYETRDRELAEMMNYGLRTDKGQQFTDEMTREVQDFIKPVAREIELTGNALDTILPQQPYRRTKENLGEIYDWYMEQPPKMRMHVEKLLDVFP